MEKSQILSYNIATNPSRLYLEGCIGFPGTKSAVYSTEVSAEAHLAYSSQLTEYVDV